METGAYIITVILILTGIFGFVGMPLAALAAGLKLGPLCHVIVPFFAFYVIDWIWIEVGAGSLPLVLLILAAVWALIYPKLTNKLNSVGLSALIGNGVGAVFYGIFKYFTDDSLRWF